MDNLVDKWKSDVQGILKKGELKPEIEIPTLVQRCPKCHNLTLKFDTETNKIKCTKCGFTYNIKEV